MIAMSYGTIPIARSVGGLYDTIISYGDKNSNGFLFDNYNAHELLYTAKLAISVYNDSKAWSELVKNAIKCNFSWDNSAKEYIKIYNKLMMSKEEE